MYYPFPKPLGELDFDDVQEFLRQAVPENLYLDYKQEFKAQKLAKSIASFANTKGGIVIIGVHENKDTKLPESWDGIDEDGTISEQINAVIANVEPYPICNFAVIKHAAPGKIMVILMIEQGMLAPYFTVHNPTIWVRTGDITGQVNQANREDLFALTKRSRAADVRIDECLELAEQIFTERYTRAEQDSNLPNNHVHPLMQESPIVRSITGVDVPMVVFSIIPRNPEEIASHKRLYDERYEFQKDEDGQPRWPMNTDMEPTRYGVARINNDAFNISSGKIEYMYINKFGLLQTRNNLLHVWDSKPFLNIFVGLHALLEGLAAASRLYRHFRYFGPLRIKLELTNLDQELQLLGTGSTGGSERFTNVDLASYDWAYDVGTYDFNNEKTKAFLEEAFTQIYLDVGFRNISPDARKMIDDFNI